MWVKFLSRNYTSFQNLQQIPILSSIYWGLQFVCLYLVSLFDFISAKKLRHENCTTKFPLALDMSRVSWKSRFRPDCVTYPIFTPHPFLRDSPGTRLHDTQRLFLICVKENPSPNLYVIGMWTSCENQEYFPKVLGKKVFKSYVFYY